VREYELIYVIQPDATAEREQEIHARTDGLIASGGAQVLLRDDWGKRKLAYEINSFQKGHYFQLNFLGNGSEINELERSLRLDADILRFLSIQANDDVQDVEARVSEAAQQAEELERRREERAKLEAEREKERARLEAERLAAGPADDLEGSPGIGDDEADEPEPALAGENLEIDDAADTAPEDTKPEDTEPEDAEPEALDPQA
jgi:small subunit ribosomal protein S6